MTRCPSHDTLHAFAFGALGDHEAARLAQHVDDCPACHAALTALDPLQPALATLDTPEPPDDLIEAVRSGRRTRHAVVPRAFAAVGGASLLSFATWTALQDPRLAAVFTILPAVLDDVTARPPVLRAGLGVAMIVAMSAIGLAARRVPTARMRA